MVQRSGWEEGKDAPPESGGVARSAGVVPKRDFESCPFRNHPSRDPLRDPAALLTQEGNFKFSAVPVRFSLPFSA
jgi:hypothetical protein